MNRNRSVLVLVAAVSLASAGFGCAPPLWTEMLGQSITMFTAKIKGGSEKVWVTGPADSGCDLGCQTGLCNSSGGLSASKGGLIGGLFGSRSKDGSSPHDRLAYEVVTNYLTQKKKMKVVETHRHNYATELGAETHKKLEIISGENGTVKTSGMSCEDLCLLDEAKKKKADKVLVYHIIEISGTELTINFRLSDVITGLVEASQTIKVKDLRATDYSYGAGRQSRGED